MQQPSLTKYALYIYEKAGRITLERDHSFATYTMSDESMIIHDMWVDPSHRCSGEGSALLKDLEETGCKEMVSTVMTNSNGCEIALMAQFKRGFKIKASDNEKIYLVRKIWEA